MNNITCNMHVKANGKPCHHYIGSHIENEAGFCKLPTIFRCTEALKEYTPTLTQSAFKGFVQCPMKYYYQYVLGVQLKNDKLSDAIKGGRIWDKWVGEKVKNLTLFVNTKIMSTNPVLSAKLTALMRAYESLNIKEDNDGSTQTQISVDMAGYNVTGYADKTFHNYIQEVKLSGRPDWYTSFENIEFQCGTYLMGNPEWEYVDLKVTRMPELKLGKKEELADYQDRIYSNIVKRPGYYFMGYNMKTRTYGKRFWRSEFDFDWLMTCYLHMVRNMRFMIDNQTWTYNPMACNVPAACFYLPIKRSGGCNLKPNVSPFLFEVKDVNDAKEGML